jgi:hypothetical protein
MSQAGRRKGRLFYLARGCILIAMPGLAQGPALTTVGDTVYRADGSPASGTLLISWPAFTTADGHTVAAGNKGVALGSNGSLTVQLAPNAGATPAGTTYLVTYQLTDGTVKTENWAVGATSPETVSQVRTLGGTSTPLTQVATQQYVNSQLATVVHLSGTETITGSKQFTISPVLPTPSQAGQAATKAYVDSSVANVGSGNFVSKAGDAMSGPLTLPADPVSPNQASTKHYVDVNAASKADLVGGLVSVGELASGVANNGSCLHGDSTWGGCGGGSGSGLTAGMLAIKYATDFAWVQSPSANLSSAGAKTVTLTACPPGVSGAEPQYYVYVSGTGTAEVHYRGHARAMARVTNPTSIAQQQHGIDDGVRSLVHHVKAPPARTSADCENAGLAVVTDGATAGWIGKYQTWSDFLPGGAVDIFPGDALNLNVPTRAAAFQAIVTQVQVSCNDLCGDHSLYEIQFAAANTEKLSFEFDSAVLNNILTTAALNQLIPITNSQVGTTTVPDLTAAAVTLVSSTTASLDAGVTAPVGGGFEVRWSDFGWGAANDQNLADRFTTQTFTLPRLAKVQDYFLRQFDGSTPPKYSRHTAALHIDYPY